MHNKLNDQALRELRLGTPFLLRSVEPMPAELHGHKVASVRRLGKRIALGFDNNLWLVMHLMIAGRLHWKSRPPSLAGKHQLAALDFAHGSLLLTEAGSKKRASLYVVAGSEELEKHNPGGLEPLECSLSAFKKTLRSENHTLKRSLTDPKLFSGIGNAYSDEILHAAGLSPIKLTQKLTDAEVERLYLATVETLTHWRDALMREAGGDMPAKVTAFRDGMAVHGRFGKSCPRCSEPIQRICYQRNETNYCARCQTGSKLLRDRALSRLLKADWPKTLHEL
ncbi:MAG: formamidopyrimidine-DNA glycosylase [Gammaproteobacteria bacterium]|nr:formamidopyrimidine-DNA glycosylase [Gammaproteobacteria bacterium]